MLPEELMVISMMGCFLSIGIVIGIVCLLSFIVGQD